MAIEYGNGDGLTASRQALIVLTMTVPTLRLNQGLIDLSEVDPAESLLRWLRRQQRLTGTKEGCGDGDCGACTVALLERDAQGHPRYRAVNACLLPMGQMAGREILTVEALAQGDQLHPVQQAMVDTAGSQCGYCTPGFVMSLFAGYYDGEFSDHVIEGNLCRCTGYQPIRRAAAHLATQAREPDRFDALLQRAPEPGAAPGALGGWHAPTTLARALALKAEHPKAQWIAGATDLGVALSRGLPLPACLIAVDRVRELHELIIGEDSVRIGAAVPLSRLETELAGVFPALDQMLPWFAARQVKNRATLGGNLGSASPIGDLLPWLLAHDAVVEVQCAAGARELPIDRYFLDYRKTALRPEELIVAVRVPRSQAIQAAYKVAKRQTDDISIVAAVYLLALDDQRRVSHARLAYGGVAAIPRRAVAVEQYLQGRVLDPDTVSAACELLRQEYTPLSDHRGSADYRRALVASLFAKFVEEQVS
jgi:xanthine dehydrogenase small subunit